MHQPHFSKSVVNEAMILFTEIQTELDPNSFTVREIVDEGWIRKRTGSVDQDKASMDRARMLLKYLEYMGWVEKPDSSEHAFSLTEAGYMKRF